MAPFPLIKLGSLAIKQISKPIGTYVKNQAKNHPSFRRFCAGFAQGYHTFEQRLARVFYDQRSMRNIQVAPLSEERAINLGSEMLAEGIIFGIAGLALALEYRRSGEKENQKEQKLQSTLERLQAQIDQLQSENDRLFKEVMPKHEHTREEIPEWEKEPSFVSRMASWVWGSSSDSSTTARASDDGGGGDKASAPASTASDKRKQTQSETQSQPASPPSSPKASSQTKASTPQQKQPGT
uniref:OPA3-like protein n=1 Tax=Chromera velia CCMP2878 TaxID=1169474 RepID=A0A0G4H139_9ALVE|eukprot:Cvel_802.t1-p1 / transcript=Cvel_802.t1 / gene=Cvel_802 / organism=Chromera_velia_CCMP2878 / gene_product=OPA3-like protein, putative / transcript_product=OPA3-like protein, putative / location=Cvel_scaffold25:42769-48064(+) / protein_length=238 / sequence_SO=supercontig / SO=protein_coding / is_pseudo=false